MRVFSTRVDNLTLESKNVPAELVRRWRLLRTAEHLGVLRKVGRKVKPAFTVFPNSGSINECLCVGSRCDRLMFESTSSPGILTHGDPSVTGEIRVVVSSDPLKPKRLTHRLEMNDRPRRARQREMQYTTQGVRSTPRVREK